ncbi:unnamed protein product [Sphagnum balticum]
MKTRNGAKDQQIGAKFVVGIGGVMEEKDIKVRVIGQQAEDVIALAPNGNIEEGVQANVEVGETYATVDVNRIEVELQRTIDMIEDQEIVVPGQEIANVDVDLHAQIDEVKYCTLLFINNCPIHPL